MNNFIATVVLYYILFPIVGCVAFYYILKNAIKNGIKEARSDDK